MKCQCHCKQNNHGIDGYLIFGHNHTDAVHPGLCDGDSYVETDEEGVLW